MRLTVILALLLSVYYDAKGQTLSLDDIINIRTMDSLTLRSFSNEKGFELSEINLDAWRSVHKYQSKAEKSTSFERTFPTGRKLFSQDTTTTDNRMVYYHFEDKDALKEFKAKIKEKGFKFKRTDTKDYRGNLFTHNIYLTKDNEIDLASEKLLGQKIRYTLIYYRRMNFYYRRMN